jgi:hypothetical protein
LVNDRKDFSPDISELFKKKYFLGKQPIISKAAEQNFLNGKKMMDHSKELIHRPRKPSVKEKVSEYFKLSENSTMKSSEPKVSAGKGSVRNLSSHGRSQENLLNYRNIRKGHTFNPHQECEVSIKSTVKRDLGNFNIMISGPGQNSPDKRLESSLLMNNVNLGSTDAGSR